MATAPNAPKRPTLTAQLMKEQAAHNLACTRHAKEREDFAAKIAALEAELAPLRAAVVAKPAAASAAKDGARAIRPNCSCTKCAGTGWFNEEDGRVCFQCEGKGFQTDADQRRNWGYQHTAVVRKTTQQPTPVRQPTVAATARAEAVKAYFTAHPGARSVSPAQLEEFCHAPA